MFDTQAPIYQEMNEKCTKKCRNFSEKLRKSLKKCHATLEKLARKYTDS